MSKRSRLSSSDLVDESSQTDKDIIRTKEMEIDEKEEVDNQKLESELDILAEKNKEVEYFKEQMEVFKKAEELTAKRLGEEMAELKLKWSRDEAAQNAEIFFFF